MADIVYPPRVELANAPTPLQPMRVLGGRLGVDLWIKRDDLTGVALTGNKVRKLEFLVQDALAAGADTLVTCGGEQSNHCRATALAAVRYGMRARLVLRTADPASPPAASGNILLDALTGAELVWISRADWARRNELMAAEAASLAAAGRTAYVIPEGGSNALGAWGYVRAMAELDAQLATLPPVDRTTVVYAAGSGGTGAGLLVGAALTGAHDRGVRVAGVNVCDDRDYFVRAIGAICAELAAAWPGPGSAPSIVPNDIDIDIIDGYVGDGYALSRREELELIRDVARAEAIVLDPVYTGKAFYGLSCELARDPARFGNRVVFLHTGGIFGLFPKAGELAPLL